MPRTRARVLTAAGAVGLVAAHAGAYAFFAGRDPYATEIFPPCPILHVTGWQCPGCGGTRSLFSLLHGDVAGSLAMNPLVVALYLALGLVGVGALLRTRAPRVASALQLAAPVVVVAAGVWSALIRNLL